MKAIDKKEKQDKAGNEQLNYVSAACGQQATCISRCPRGLAKGLKPQHPNTQGVMRRLAKKSPVKMTIFAVLYLSQILVTAFSASIAWKWGWQWGCSLYVVAIIWIARTMRALECMNHEFGHGVWPIRHQSINDAVGNVLVAFPVGLSVRGMRQSHNDPHHNQLGKADIDPDFKRYAQLDVEGLDRSSLISFSSGVVSRLPAYNVGWIKAMGVNPRRLLPFAAWHTVVIIALQNVAEISLLQAVADWVAFWFIPMTVVLPVIRFVGEAGKHIYGAGDTIIAVTVSNIGWIHRMLVHPFGDGYHTVHHLRADIPGYNLHLAHVWLMNHEPDYRLGLRVRTKILQSPRCL